MFFLDLTRVALKIRKVTLRFTTIRISFAAVLHPSHQCVPPHFQPEVVGKKDPGYLDRSLTRHFLFLHFSGEMFRQRALVVTALPFRWSRALAGPWCCSNLRSLEMTLFPWQGPRSPTALLRPDSAHVRMKEIGAEKMWMNWFGWYEERYGFWSQWDIPSLAWRKLLKLLAEDGEKMPKARRHGSFIYVNVCHRFFREDGKNRWDCLVQL